MKTKTVWFDKLPAFRKSIKALIDEGKDDIDQQFSIRLPEVVVKLGEIVPQIIKWAKVLANVKTFMGHLETEFEAIDSELFLEMKQEMVLEQDDRKKKSLKVYSFTDSEIKMKRNALPKRLAFMQQLQALKGVQTYIESVCYWPSVNTISVLESMTKFSVASEKNYK
jgi:hypothetical protein